MEDSCLDLALEGERLCKAGDYGGGVSFFESALLVGTEDLQILSAIYSQLGNAYFHLQEYNRALEYHRHDLTLTRTIGDEVGEAKASGNLGNTLKVLGRYNEAVVCCQRHLDISRAIYDKVGQARALYNFGNVYHAKAKGICWSGVEPGDFPEEARIALRKAAQYYEANLVLVKELGDPAAQGRTLGNLGNTFYLLGEFEKSVSAHEKRLLLAKEFGDKSAERRAHCNLGNAHIFLRQFNAAADHYKKTLQLARLLRDPAVEAQACYSLGNTYTLLQDYQRAIEYHLKHLLIAQELHDRVGEGRAYWSLGNAHTALGNHQEALDYAEKHLEIAKETGDRSGEITARMNLSDLRLVVSLKANSPQGFLRNTNSPERRSTHQASPQLAGIKSVSEKTESGEQLEKTPEEFPRGDPPTHKFSQDWEEDACLGSSKSNTMKASTKLFLFHGLRSKKHKNGRTSSPREQQEANRTETEVQDQQDLQAASQDTIGDESFFDLLSRFQGNRMDDQRCSVDGSHPAPPGPPSPSSPSSPSSPLPVAENRWSSASDPSDPFKDPGRFLELLASCQARRLDDQRVSLSHFPGLRLSTSDPLPTPSTCNPTPLPNDDCPVSPSQAAAPETPAEQVEGDDVFFDLLARCQGSRLNEQRCAAPPSSRGPTVPDEDFFSLILRSQSNRMEEQRVPPPPPIDSQSRPE